MKYMRGIIFLLLCMVLFLSCSRANENPGYFRNGVGEWERAYTWEKWEPAKGEMKIQTFKIGDSTRSFIPGSPEAEAWIAQRRETLRNNAIRVDRNPDFYIDRNIEEGERRY